MSQAALAAGMPVKAPMAPPPALYNWNGIYFGLHWGGGWGNKDWAFTEVFGLPIPPPFPATNSSVSGPLAGAQLGFNWQSGPWLVGVEGQWSWSDLDGGGVCPNTGASCDTEVKWVGSVAARVGIAANNWLIFLKGGWAFAREEYQVNFTNASFFNETSGNVDRDGWMVGFGFEYGFAPAWSIKAEVDYMDFGKDAIELHRVNAAAGGHVETADIDQYLVVAKVGINYRFNWGP